jgi:hypothetical protein
LAQKHNLSDIRPVGRVHKIRFKAIEYGMALIITEAIERITGEPCRTVPTKGGLVIIERYTGSEWITG